MSPKLPPHVKRVRNRAGREYLYLMRHRGTSSAQTTIRLPDDPGSREFWAAYADHMRLSPPRHNTNAVRELISVWQASPEWLALSSRTQAEWTRQLAVIDSAWGDLEVRGIEPHHVLALRDERASTPASTNNMLRCLSSMLGWSVPRKWTSANPCREVRKLKGGDGYAPWPWDTIEAAHAQLRADLWVVVALALYTGQRLSDVLAMRWNAIERGVVHVRQDKTGKDLWIPMHHDLRRVVDAAPKVALTIAASSKNRPWTVDGFQSSWNKLRPAIIAERGLVFHGLRKSAVVTLLEAGCTEAETQSVTGQGSRMVAHYARQVNQRKLAAAAILKWEKSGT